MILLILNIFFQLPPGTRNPDDNVPMDFADPFNIIMFIALPIAAVILYMLWKRQKRKDRTK